MLRRGIGLTSLVRPSRYTAVTSRSLVTSSCMQQQVTTATDESMKMSFQEAKPASEIPGPMRLPILKSLPAMLMDKDFDNKKIQLYWKKLIRVYGPVVRLDAPLYPSMVMVTNPDDFEKVSRATMDNPVRNGFFALAQIRRDAVDNYFDKKGGLLTENNEEWWRVRSRVQTPMMKPKNVTQYMTSMDQVALDFMDKIAELQQKYGEMPHDFQIELYKWALESVGLVALNRRLGCLEPNLSSDSVPMTLIREANNMFDALNDTEIGGQMWKIFPTKAYKKLEKSHTEFLRIADANIRETEDRLLAQKEMSNSGELPLLETLLMTPNLTRKDVVTMILDMLFAGIDTVATLIDMRLFISGEGEGSLPTYKATDKTTLTSHTIGFTLYLLARNPECQGKLQEEVDSILGDHKGPLTTKHMAQFSYLKAVVKESLRHFPIAIGNVRTLQSDLVLSGYTIPKGFAVACLSMLSGQDEEYFPRAKEFIPERWLRHRPLGPIHPYASLPFGTGTRMCIGRRIAEQEIYTFLARVMQRYTVDYKYNDMDIVTRLVFVPSEPLRFSFTERR